MIRNTNACTSCMDHTHQSEKRKVRVGLIYVCAPRGAKVWPYIDFDYGSRKAEIGNELRDSCPGIEFVPLSLSGGPDEEIGKVKKLADEVDGLLVFLLSTNWELTETLLPTIGQWGMPTVFVDEPYAGSGVFLCHGAKTVREGSRVVMLSSCRFQDVVDVVRCFDGLGVAGANIETFLSDARKTRQGNFRSSCDLTCKKDPVKIRDVNYVIKRLQETKILRVVPEKAEPYKALGATVESVTFDEINAAFGKVDREQAYHWADKWIKEAWEVAEPSREDVRDSAAIYLAMKNLMIERGARAVTVDCLGGFYSGKLPGYPCLGYRQLNDDGLLMGTCEAQIPDTLAMIICRDMFDRASFASDPVLDTSTNQIIYAHCVAPTKMFGPDSDPNDFKIRSHAEDGLGASIQSMMPLGYMTTSMGIDPELKSMVMHQAMAVANVDEPKGCRTKLAAEVKGDIDKLFLEWDKYAWHRVTVYGDVQEPLMEVARALDLEVIHEA